MYHVEYEYRITSSLTLKFGEKFMRSHNLFTLTMLSASFLFGSFVINAEPSLEEVVVTARKTDENLRDVPIAISAFTTSD